MRVRKNPVIWRYCLPSQSCFSLNKYHKERKAIKLKHVGQNAPAEVLNRKRMKTYIKIKGLWIVAFARGY